jgi:putative peptidoglycan lipid II flippase
VGTTTEVKTAQEKRRIARAAGLVSAMTLVSRLLGLVREMVFAALLGAGFYSDAFRIAFRIPNLLRDLFAEGALSSAFVPTFARTAKHGGAQEAFRLANRVLTVVAVLLSAVVIAGILLAGPIVGRLASGFATEAGKTELTVLLTRVMMPFLALVSFAAIAMGMLNAEERFAIPALSPALFNVVAIVCAAVLWAMGLPPKQVALGWAIGTLLGGLAQFMVQVPSLRRLGWRFRPDWAPRDPGLLQVARLMAPATVGLGAVQFNILVNSHFASEHAGAVSWLDYAFRLLYLPIGLFGVALGTIATAGLARSAAAGDLDGLRLTLRQSLSMLAYVTLPATVGLMAVGQPIVRLLYQHGAFRPEDTPPTAEALFLYSFGLVGYTGVKVVAPAFYALGRPRVPLAGSVLAVLANLTIVGLGYPRFGFRAIAIGTAVGSLLNAALLVGSFERGVGGLRGHGLLRPVLRMAVGAGVMGVATWATAGALEALLGTRGFVARLLVALLPVALGVGLYGLLTRLLRVGEADVLWRMLGGRLRRRLASAEVVETPRQ